MLLGSDVEQVVFQCRLFSAMPHAMAQSLLEWSSMSSMEQAKALTLWTTRVRAQPASSAYLSARAALE
jgi:hypothetical protein